MQSKYRSAYFTSHLYCYCYTVIMLFLMLITIDQSLVVSPLIDHS